ncbi:MAG TPA: glutamine synthetase III [Anaerolineae bacterium]|nr:glutamine synthetase III [Anaerolineae bacterium]
MSGYQKRVDAIKAITEYELPYGFNWSDEPTGHLFGSNVFNLAVMKERLPKNVYNSLVRTIANGEQLDIETADIVAAAMKDWALEKGATHYGHVFYPLTGLSAEKNDSFFTPSGDGQAVTEFSGEYLVQGEPDGSSFPTGGIRPTHQARGYTAWDVTSPAFLLENPNGMTLCIPSAFVSWTGEALDQKTPLMRSTKALNEQAQRVLRLFGHHDVTLVQATAGAEQEYFLIDRNFYLARPDLISAGRTLFGAAPPKGQEFDDHYFGAINERVQACMFEFERELFKLGVPVKTRHNEVAPSQHEIAPVHANVNIACDQQQLVMTILQRVAEKYGLACLLHEKPFAGVNGSGKHVNYSFGSSTQGNLLDPGDEPHENAQFLVFCSAVIRAVSKYAPMLRAAIASASNDHRLGANEAPPAIISIFLGDQLSDVFEQIQNMGGAKSSKVMGTLQIGVDTLPVLPKHSGDRNRTSPFAFTGNRFEFRAVGSKQSIAAPVTILNTAIAESLDYIATELEKADDLYEGIHALLKTIMDEHGSIIFNGDGYSDEWQEEAAKRGLPNLRTSVEALPHLADEAAVELFTKYDVLSEREAHSRMDVALEQYVMTVHTEAKLVAKLGKTMIFPAAIRFQSELAMTCANLKAVGYTFDTDTLDYVTALVKKLQDSLAVLVDALAHEADSLLDEAAYACETLLPAMLAVREHADALEEVVADDLWPLPTYQEMLFLK